MSIPQCMKTNSLSVKLVNCLLWDFIHIPLVLLKWPLKTSYLLDLKVNQSAIRSSYSNHIPTQHFKGLNLLVFTFWTVITSLSRLVWPWYSGICIAYSNVSGTQRVNEEDNRLALRKHAWSTRYNSACLLFLVSISPLNNIVLNLQFKEAFGIILILSKQWQFTVDEAWLYLSF